MKKSLFYIAPILLIMTSMPAGANTQECEKAEALKWIQTGHSIAELQSHVGKADFYDSYYSPGILRNDIYSYYPVCDNQTIYIFTVRKGQVTNIERKIQR